MEGPSTTSKEVAVAEKPQIATKKKESVNVIVTFHTADKQTIVKKITCSGTQTLATFVLSLKERLKINEKESIFLYFNKFLADQKMSMKQLHAKFGTQEGLKIDAATTEIF